MTNIMIEGAAVFPRGDFDPFTPIDPPYQLMGLREEEVVRFTRAGALFHELDRGISLFEKGKLQPGKLVSILAGEVELPVYDVTEQGPIHRRVMMKREIDLSNNVDMHFARYLRSILPRLLHDVGNLSSLKGERALIDTVLDRVVLGGTTDDIDELVGMHKEEFIKFRKI